MPPPRSLQAFLKAARSALAAPAAQRASKLTVVVGNESADLDSLCSAVLLAYFRSHTPPHASLHVPLSNLPREDLRLRPELQAALAGFGGGDDPDVSLDSLITLSDLPADLTAADTSWLLVDHNELTGDLAERFAASVVGCIDHHIDEGTVPDPPPDGNPRIVSKAGSCASLVVDYAKDAWRTLAAQDPDQTTDRTLARLALAPILVDTHSLQSASKTTNVDRRAVELAESFLVGGGGEGGPGYKADAAYKRDHFFGELSRLKDDISRFSYNDLLRKDYKQWREEATWGTATGTVGAGLTLGMSTIVQGMGYLLEHVGPKETFLKELREFAQQRKLDLAAVMTVQHDDKVPFGRQLLLWAFNKRAAKAARAFVEQSGSTLGLEQWGDGLLDDTSGGGGEDGEEEWRACWTQGRTDFSRKQVAPYLRDAMRAAE